MSFTATETTLDEDTGKPVSDLLTYTYADGDSTVVTWRRDKTILQDKFIDDVGGWKHLAAKLIGFDGAYLRFSDTVEVQRTSGSTPNNNETQQGDAIWELMYFGKNHQQ